MNRRYVRSASFNNSYRIIKIISNHIEKNIKEYFIVSLIFLIGIIVGLLFINKASDTQKEEINTYVSSFTEGLKENKTVNEMALLFNSLKKNILLAIFLWFMGSTVIGILIVYITICFRGFCLGYTISSIILALGTRKRNIILIYFIILTKYIIYTWNFYNCS